MRVVEGLDILDTTEALLQTLKLSSNNRRIGARNIQRGGELINAALEVLSLSHGIKQAREESALLRSNLGSGGVACDGAVAGCPDVGGSLDDEVLVDGEAAAGVLLCGDLGHEVSDDGADGVTGCPDEEAVGEDGGGFLAVGAGGFGFDGVLGDFLDGGLGHDGDFLLFEGGLGVLDQLLGEGGEHVGEGLDQSDLELVADLRDPFADVLVEEVLELAGEFDAGWATADDDHVEETLDFLGRLVLECSGLDAIHDLGADALGIADLLQEAGVLGDTLDAEGGVLGADGDDELVVGDLGLRGGALDLRVIGDADGLADWVDVGGFGFVESNGGLLVSKYGADRLHDGPVLDGTGRA